MSVEDLINPEDGRFCYCGSAREAVEVAEKLYVDGRAADCSIWMLQVSIALRAIAIRDIRKRVQGAASDDALRKVCGRILAECNKHVKSGEDINALVQQRKEEMNN